MTRKLTIALLATTALGLGFAGAAQAADVYVPPPAEPVYVPEPAAFSWSGVYFGAHVGYVWTKPTDPWPSCNWLSDIRGENGDPEYLFPGATICDSYYAWNYYSFELDGDYVSEEYYWNRGDRNGFIWGGQVGINQQYGSLVLGLEADVSGVHNVKNYVGDEFAYWHSYYGNYDGNYWVESETKLDWLATFRGRIGAAFGHEGRVLAYGTGGLAVAGLSTQVYADYYADGPVQNWCDPSGGGGDLGSCGFIGQWDHKKFYQLGYAVGAGLEWAVTNNITLGLEYLYVGLPWGKAVNSTIFYGDDGRSFTVNQTVGIDSLQVVKAKVNLKL